MIELEWLRLYRVQLALRTPFRSAESVQRKKDTYLIQLEASDGATGWSEISAQTDPSYWPETVATCLEIIEHHLVAQLRRGFASAYEIHDALVAVKGNQMARASIEMAFFDLAARTTGVGLWYLLGAAPERTHVPAGVSLSLNENVADLIADLTASRAAGYRHVKIKIAPHRDAILAALTDYQDPSGHRIMDTLVLDANASYASTNRGDLASVDNLGVALLEQPLGEHDFVGHAELARHLRTPIGLDESIAGVDDVMTALQLGMRPTINLKPSRVGGYVESLRIIERCQREGLHLRIGGMLETGIGRAHNLALASHAAFDRVGDLAASDHYFAKDITPAFALEPDGTIARPDGTGLGVVPDSAWLAEVPCREIRIRY